MEFIKKYWKVITVIVILTVIGVSNSLYVSKLLKKYEQAQIELIDIKSERIEAIEVTKQNKFNSTVDSIQIIVVTKEKIVYEIKESIKSIPVDINVIRIQDSINTAFNNRFP
tara:strand:- start:2629 stop:2964 length:336 start_codon:yes stop_codon:yes gene_type:complete